MVDSKQLDKIFSGIRSFRSSDWADFENPYGIRPDLLCQFCNNYLEYLEMLQCDDEDYGVAESLAAYNTSQNRYQYYEDYCFDNEDPLTEDKAYRELYEMKIPFCQKGDNTICQEYYTIKEGLS